jgi:hypothetical protein
MSPAVEKQITDAEQKLVVLIREIHNTPTMERVNLWIARMTKDRKLSEFIHDANVPPKDRVAVARSLVDILLTKQYERLPELKPMENANHPPASKTPTPAPASSPSIASVPSQERTAEPPDMPAPDELRAEIRRQVRAEFADLLERIAKVLRE